MNKNVGHNLSMLNETERDKINVDLAASAIAFKLRYNIAVTPDQVEKKQPEHLRSYFRKRLAFYRKVSRSIACMTENQRTRKK